MVDLLALGNDTVMASRAVVVHALMVKGAAGKIIKFEGVTIGAIPGGRHVIRVLPRTDIAVMA